ncbi:MAG TPA: alpha/beta fold hydrolase, partial [Thermomicrobiales bacterium]|nr:alpha/beta fold hydrolase [Thermomicrobiales bacterium]
ERDPEAAAPIRVVTRPDYKQDGRGFVNDVRQSLFVVNVESGEHRQLTTVANDHSAPRWHIDGTTIGVQRSTFHGLYQQLILVNAVSGDETIIGEPGETIRAWTWTPDGSSLVLIHAPHYAFNASIVVRELESGSERIVARDLDWTPAVLVGWTDEGRLLIAGASAGEVQLGALDISADHPTPQCIGSPGGHPAGELRGSRQLAVISDVPEHVGELDVYDLISRTSTEITSLNTSLDLPEIEKRQVENEGLTIDYWITKPVDFSPERRYPVVLQIHGGPHGAHGPGFNATAQLLAAAGYVVVLPNPRGSGGYSDAFTSAVVGDWGGGDWRDLLAALDDALTLPYTDADRVGVYGYSYGGYMSAWAIGQTDRFKAAVIGAPITDLIANYGTADIGHHGGEFQWGGPVRERWDHLLARSPITHAHKATTPTLLLHPEEDQRCPISGSEQLFISLLHAGVETEFVRYPGQSHGMMGSGPAEYRLDFYERLIAWFDRFVR